MDYVSSGVFLIVAGEDCAVTSLGALTSLPKDFLVVPAGLSIDLVSWCLVYRVRGSISSVSGFLSSRGVFGFPARRSRLSPRGPTPRVCPDSRTLGLKE